MTNALLYVELSKRLNRDRTAPARPQKGRDRDSAKS
jgi:hypothetical protein